MNSLVDLKKKNEDLARELADSCMKYVDLTFAYREVVNKMEFQKSVFKDYVMKCKPTLSEAKAREQVDIMLMLAKKPIQLELPIQLENKAKNE